LCANSGVYRGMDIENQLQEDLKAAMRSKDAPVVACIRQVKSKVQEAINAKDFKGPVDNALHQKVIASYVKSLEKAVVEMSAAGEKTQALCATYQAEITLLQKYLPTLMGVEETRACVAKVVASLPERDVKHAGKVVGMLMKEHKGLIDAGLAKQCAEELLKA
jgi:uncharacterized protein YqeY